MIDSMMSFKPTRKSKLQELVDTVSPHVEAARDAAAPHVENARERLVNDVLPAVQSAVDNARDQAAVAAAAAAETAREQAGPAAAEAKRRGLAAGAALKGEEPARKGGKLKKLVLLGGLAGAVAFVAKKLGANDDQQAWQSSYSPKPAPSMAPPPPPAAGATDDTGGGTPGEVLADSEDKPHQATTPDAPAEVTEIDAQPDENRL